MFHHISTCLSTSCEPACYLICKMGGKVPPLLTPSMVDWTMRVDFRFVGKTGATLAGLSFAALAFAITCAYDPGIPAVLKERMIWFLVWTVTCNILFLVCSLASFWTMSFLFNKNSTKNQTTGSSGPETAVKWSGRLCLVCYSAGLIGFLVALSQIISVIQGHVTIELPHN